MEVFQDGLIWGYDQYNPIITSEVSTKEMCVHERDGEAKIGRKIRKTMTADDP